LKLRLLALVVLSTVVVAACGASTEVDSVPLEETATLDTTPLPEGAGTRENPYVGRGIVTEIGNGELLINHETVPGWMPPMQMAFPVIDEVDISGIEVGEQIRFDIEVGGDAGWQIIAIEPTGGE
jgi:Cu/Ag efflux protein CusF